MLLPSTDHRDDIPEADMPIWKIARFTAPTCRFEVGESFAAAARQTGHILARRVDYGFINTVDASIRAFESRVMTAVEEEDCDALRAQRQRIGDGDRLTMHIQLEHNRFRELSRTRDAGPQDGPTDAGSSC
ncbi:hypothetical protein Tco_0384793 [Tanacetum coccineum]